MHASANYRRANWPSALRCLRVRIVRSSSTNGHMARSSSGARVRVVSSSSGARVRGLECSSPRVTIVEFHTNKLASATARTRHSRISSA